MAQIPKGTEQYSIAVALTPQDLSDTINLSKEYAASLETDLSFQNFNAELASIP